MLTRKRVPVEEERSTRRPLTDAEATGLLAEVEEVWIARGRKLDRRAAAEARLEDLQGRTNGYRSPILRRGRVLLVGFHGEGLEELLS